MREYIIAEIIKPPLYSARVIVPNPEIRGQALLLRRIGSSMSNGNMLEGPGGKVKVDRNFRPIQSRRQAAINETFEECRLIIDIVSDFLLVTEDTRVITDGQYEGRELRPAVALGKVIGGVLSVALSKQHYEGGYFYIPEALARDDLTIPTRVGLEYFGPQITHSQM